MLCYIFTLCDDVPVYLLQHVVWITSNILKFLWIAEILYFSIHNNRIIIYVQSLNKRTNIVHMAFHFEWPFLSQQLVSPNTLLFVLKLGFVQIFRSSLIYFLLYKCLTVHITFICTNNPNIKIFFLSLFFCDLRRWKCELKVWHFLSENFFSSAAVMFWEIL